MTFLFLTGSATAGAAVPVAAPAPGAGQGGRGKRKRHRQIEQVVRLAPQGEDREPRAEILSTPAQPVALPQRSERPATPLRVPKLTTLNVREAQLPGPSAEGLVLQATVDMPIISRMSWEAEEDDVLAILTLLSTV